MDTYEIGSLDIDSPNPGALISQDLEMRDQERELRADESGRNEAQADLIYVDTGSRTGDTA